MLIIGIIFCIIIAVIIILVVTSKTAKSEEVVEKKEFAMPPQRRYPFMYFKDCHFYADAVSRFAYSEEEIEQFLVSMEEAFEKADYTKSLKLTGEIIKIIPRADKVWIRRITAIFMDVMYNEKCWNEKLSKMILNSCFGFLQCYDTVIEKSIAVKHVLLPTLLKNIDELIKYQNRMVTKYHNFEVYNMLLNIYYVLPYKDILGMLSNNLLEDKTDKEFESEAYPRQTIKNLLRQVDVLRTRNTSKLQESFDTKKITNCTLLTDDKLEANIVAFELSFEPGIKREKIEAIFFDNDGNELHFGKDVEDRYIDVFEVNSDRGVVAKEEIVLLTDEVISRVRLRIYRDEDEKKPDIDRNIKKQDENKQEDKKEEKSNEVTEDNDVLDDNEEDNANDNEENFEQPKTENSLQTLMYPSLEGIKDIVMSDTQFVALKENDTVVSLGVGDKLNQQTNTWKDISKIYVKNDAVYGVRKNGSVIYAGPCSYEGIEYMYSWENVESLSLGEKHMVAITKNATMYALGGNSNGECDIDEWYDIIQVATAYHTVGLCKDGKVFATGENNFGECDVKSWQDIVQVAVGDFYTLGLTSSGKVLATGLNSCGQCNVNEWANIKKIFANGNMSVGLRYDGKVVTAGKNSYHYGDIKNWNKIKDIVMSGNRIIGIEYDGTVRATGKPYRNFANGEWSDVKKIVINNNNIVALKEDGSLCSNELVFGNYVTNNFSEVAQICEDLENNRIAMVNNNGAVNIANKVSDNSGVESVYPTFYDVKLVDMSKNHIVMLKNDGTVSYMRFSDSFTENIQGWENIIDVEAGDGFLLGLDISGKVVAFGDNNHGQCDVSEWRDIVKIRASGKRAVGLSIDGKLFMSGISEFGEDDFIKIPKGVKDFALTSQQTMILSADGTVKVTYHPTGVNTESVKEWRNIKKVVARGNNFLCLSEEGKVYSTIPDEAEIGSWEEVQDIDASGNYVWAVLKS